MENENSRRIHALLADYRLGFLEYETLPMFKSAKRTLIKMATRLRFGNDLNTNQLLILSAIETHVNNLDPHFEKGMVNDELGYVCFVTTRRGPNDLIAIAKERSDMVD